MLITNSQITGSKFGGSAYGQVIEVSPEGDRLFQLDVGFPPDSGVTTYGIYRAERLPDIRR
jgi:hypothetical protein